MMRRSFLPPIPEFEEAADLLSQAADSLLAGDLGNCAKCLVEADLRPLREFAFLLAGPIKPEIHLQSRNPIFDPVPKENRPRMPTSVESKSIFARDGYRCRFCQSRIVVKDAHKIFAKFLPEQARKGRTNEDNHFGISTLTGSIDHLLPYSRGGGNELENLVTACGPCQFGRNQWTLEEVQIESPMNYEPIVDDWDGLLRLAPLGRKSFSFAA